MTRQFMKRVPGARDDAKAASEDGCLGDGGHCWVEDPPGHDGSALSASRRTTGTSPGYAPPRPRQPDTAQDVAARSAAAQAVGREVWSVDNLVTICP